MILKGHFELFTILYKLYVRFNYKSSKTFGTWAQMGTHSMKIDVYELKLAPHPLLINWGLLYSEAFLLKIHVSFFSLLRPFSAKFFSERPFSEKFFYPQIVGRLKFPKLKTPLTSFPKYHNYVHQTKPDFFYPLCQPECNGTAAAF